MSGKIWLRRILLPFLLSRAGLWAVGILALALLGSARERMPGNLLAHTPAALPLEIWARWDSEWYLLIAREGYAADRSLATYSAGYRPGDTAGFFPLYPLLLTILERLGVPEVAAGILLSNMALLTALTLLYLLVREEWDDHAAGAAVWVLLGFPFSLFFSAVYCESVALALTLGGFLLARRRRWGWLGLCGFFCALARPTGLLVAPALAWEVKERRGGWRGALALLGFPAGVAAFSACCGFLFSDPLIWETRQERWRGSLSGPWKAFKRFFESSPSLHGAHNSILEFCLALLFLVALVPVLRKTPRSWGTYALLCVMVPLGSTLWSFGRLALMAFPVFAWMGFLLRRDSSALAGYLALCLPLGGLLMAFFACGWWAG
ncbi:MAG: hypothetical protein DMH00_06950 [Acidobacteria bacterium]|nr:MAG: hypothetical protein DMH00_06950 [Acidobacteriota bacterium]